MGLKVEVDDYRHADPREIVRLAAHSYDLDQRPRSACMGFSLYLSAEGAEQLAAELAAAAAKARKLLEQRAAEKGVL